MVEALSMGTVHFSALVAIMGGVANASAATGGDGSSTLAEKVSMCVCTSGLDD